ncbi:Glucose/ribitol dehydrogenase [Gracilaria domingensis]|nr:Glucose/ribitol dehydrogenase [Gracilaria domingensis]
MSVSGTFAERYGPWAVVTGASSGIGAEFARQLGDLGLKLVVVARRDERLQTLSQEIRRENCTEVKIVATDLTREEGWRQVISECTDLEVGLLINNAGIQLHGSFFRDPIEKHLDLVTLNCAAIVALTHALGRMAARKRGGIIFTSSLSSLPTPWLATYCASKSFVTCFGKTVREELLGHNVNVTVLEPSVVKTEMSEELRKTVDFEKQGLSEQPVEECVKEALEWFSKGYDRVTPGLINRLKAVVIRSLPEGVRMRIVKQVMADSMNDEVKNF